MENELLKTAVSFLYFSTVAADGELDESEIKDVDKSEIFNKYSSADFIKAGADFEKNLSIKKRIDSAFNVVNSELSKNELKKMFRDFINIVAADGEINDNESALLSLYSDAINLTEKEIDSIYEKWKKDLKKEVEELQAKNDLAYALGFVYFWLVAADGDISDEEIIH